MDRKWPSSIENFFVENLKRYFKREIVNLRFGPDQKQRNRVGAHIILDFESATIANASRGICQSYFVYSQTPDTLKRHTGSFSRFQRRNELSNIIIDFTVGFAQLL